jgi:hypothetical protein
MIITWPYLKYCAKKAVWYGGLAYHGARQLDDAERRKRKRVEGTSNRGLGVGGGGWKDRGVGKGGGLKNISRCLPNGRTGNGMSKDGR